MHHTTRIKVSDLLLHVGQIDTIPLSGIVLDTIVGLDTPGIRGRLVLQSIDDTTIVATLADIVCAIHDVSDVSADPYIRTVRIDSFVAYFSLLFPAVDTNKEHDDPIFPIDPKNLTIDIHDLLYQSIALETPFVKRTPAEEEALGSVQADDLDTLDGPAIGGQVVFRKAK